MSKFAVIACTLFLAELCAAQIPTSGNVFVGYSYYNTRITPNRTSLNGWEASLEGKVFPFVGIVADFSGNYGSYTVAVPGSPCPTSGCPSGVTNVHNILFGPRVSVPAGKWRPFGEVMFGVSRAGTGFSSDTSFATAIGGGLDYRIFRPLAGRFQLDYVHSHLFNTGQSNVRLSTGLVVRF